MNNGTCILFVIFYVFRHYKMRLSITKKREMIADFKKCNLILKRMKQNLNPYESLDIVKDLIKRTNIWGSEIKLNYPLRYADYFDSEIILLIIKLTDEVIQFAKWPFYKMNLGHIYHRLLILHNLPRALLNYSSGDMSITKNFHISKEEALEYARSMNLCD